MNGSRKDGQHVNELATGFELALVGGGRLARHRRLHD